MRIDRILGKIWPSLLSKNYAIILAGMAGIMAFAFRVHKNRIEILRKRSIIYIRKPLWNL